MGAGRRLFSSIPPPWRFIVLRRPMWTGRWLRPVWAVGWMPPTSCVPRFRLYPTSRWSTAPISAIRSRRLPAKRPGSSRPARRLSPVPGKRRRWRRSGGRPNTNPPRFSGWVNTSGCGATPAPGFTYYGVANSWSDMHTRLTGDHQVDNAAIVLAACEILSQTDPIDFSAIRDGLKTHQWPGRLEMWDTAPPILIDGAHNLMAARHLGRFLKEQMADRKVTLVIGILDDKPYRSMLQSILPHCHRAF